MDQRKLTPVELVASRMAEKIDCMDENEIMETLVSGLQSMMGEAEDELIEDESSPRAMQLSHRFLVFAELIAMFGASLDELTN